MAADYVLYISGYKY